MKSFNVYINKFRSFSCNFRGISSHILSFVGFSVYLKKMIISLFNLPISCEFCYFTGSALKCWQCNSLKGGNCADDFDPSALSQTERNHFLQECPSTPLNLRKLNSTMQPVCRKLITLGELLIAFIVIG